MLAKQITRTVLYGVGLGSLIAVIYFVLVQAASLIFAGLGRLLFRWKV